MRTAVSPTIGRRAGLALAATVLTLAGGGCRLLPSPAPTPTAPVSSSLAGIIVVNMTGDRQFDPPNLTIPPGTTLTWHNASQLTHTVTDDPTQAQDKSHASVPTGAQAWDSGSLGPGQNFSQLMSTPGTYRYFCIPHEGVGMVATLIVSDT